MQRGQKPPERALHRQFEHFQQPGQHRVFGYKPDMIQPKKPNVDGQHHTQNELIHGHYPWHPLHRQCFLDQLLESQLLQHGGYREQASVGSKVLAFEVIVGGRADFIRLGSNLWPALWHGRFASMLRTVYHHLGDSWKWAREGTSFAASLFYNSISGVSKWLFPFRFLQEFPFKSRPVHRSGVITPGTSKTPPKAILRISHGRGTFTIDRMTIHMPMLARVTAKRTAAHYGQT